MVRLSGTFSREGVSGSSSSKTAHSATFAPSAIGDSPQRAFKSLPLWFKDSTGGPAPDSMPAKTQPASAAVMAAGPSSSSSSSGLTGWVRTRKNSKGATMVLDQAGKEVHIEPAGSRSRGASQDLLRASARSPETLASSAAEGKHRRDGVQGRSSSAGGSGLSRFFSSRRKAAQGPSSVVSPTRKQPPRALEALPTPNAKPSPPVAIISSAYSQGKFSPQPQEVEAVSAPSAAEKPLPSPKPSASSTRAKRPPPLGAADADGAAFEFPPRSAATQPSSAGPEVAQTSAPANVVDNDDDEVQYATRVPRPAHAEHTSSRSAPLLMPSNYPSSSDPLAFVYNPTRVNSPNEDEISPGQAQSPTALAEASRRNAERKRTNSLADRLTMFLAGGGGTAGQKQVQENSASRQPSQRRPQTADSTARLLQGAGPTESGSKVQHGGSGGGSLRRRPSQLLLLGSSRKDEGLHASAPGTISSAPAATTKRKLSLRRLKPSIFTSAASPPTTPEIHSWRTPPLDKHPRATAGADDEVQVVSSATAPRGHAISRVPVPRLDTPDYADSFGDPRAMLREVGIASRASTSNQGAPSRSATPGNQLLLENMPRSETEESASAANESSEIQGLGLITGEEAQGITATTTLLHRSGSLSAGRRRKEDNRERKEVVGEAKEPKSRGGTRDTQDTAVGGTGSGVGDSSSDTKMAGPRSPSRPYSLISADGTDTPILRLRKLVVDTDEPAEGAVASEDFFFRPPGSGSNVSSIRSGGRSGSRRSSEANSSPDPESKDKAAQAAQAAGAAATASASAAAPSRDSAPPKQAFAVVSPSMPSETSSKDAPSTRSRKPMPRLSLSDAASSANRHSDSHDSKRMSQDNASRRASQASWTVPGAGSSRFSMVSGPRIRASLQPSEAGTAFTAGSDGMSALEAEVGQARRLEVAPAVMERVNSVEEWTRTIGRKSVGVSTSQQERPQPPLREALEVEVPAHPRRASASSREPSSGSRSEGTGLATGGNIDALPEVPDEGPVASANDFHDSWHPFNPQLSEAVMASSPPRSRSHPQNLTMASAPVNPPSPNTAAADEAARLGKAPAKRVRRSQSQPLRQKRSDKSPGHATITAAKHSLKTGTSRSSRNKPSAPPAPRPDSSPEASPQVFRNVLRPSQSGNLRERRERERGADDVDALASGLAASAPPRKVRSATKLRREGTEQSTASSAIAPATPVEHASPPPLRRKGSEKVIAALSPQSVSSPRAGGSTTGSGSQIHSQQPKPKPTYATSEEAALAKRREAAERERRHRERQERKDAERQAAYARRKKSDPLLAARLALVGLTEIPPQQELVPEIPGSTAAAAGRKRDSRADEESPAASEAQQGSSSKLLSVADAAGRGATRGGPHLSPRAESTLSFATAQEEEQLLTTDSAAIRSRGQSSSSVGAGTGAPTPFEQPATAPTGLTSSAPRVGGHAHTDSHSSESSRRRVLTPDLVKRASQGVDRPATASSMVTVDSATTLAALDFPVPPNRSRIAQTSDDGTVLARGKLEDWESPRPVSVVSRSSIVEPRFVDTVREVAEEEEECDLTLRAMPPRREGEGVFWSAAPTSSTFVEPPSSTTSSKLTIHGVTRPLSSGTLRDSPTKARMPEIVGGPSPVISDAASVALTPDLEGKRRVGESE